MKKIEIISLPEMVYVATSIQHASAVKMITNAALLVKFDLTACPAFEGGVMGKQIELVNNSERGIGLRNNLSSKSKLAEGVLIWYEKLLRTIFSEEGFGIQPKILLTMP